MSQSRNFSAEPPNVTILQMLNGMWLSHAIQAAAYYDFASLIQDERKTTEELSQLTNTQEEWVFRVLRFLAAFGIFAEDAPRTFKNTKLSTYLRDDIPGSMRAMACMMGLKRVREEWGALEQTMQQGTPAVQLLGYGETYTYLDAHPEESSLFDAAMTSFSAVVNNAVTNTYDFSPFKRLVDVGGGVGSFLNTLLARYPHLQGMLFERAVVIEQVKRAGDAAFELVSGDFFQANDIPPADAYVIKEVLHNWPDQECVTILTNCRRRLRDASGRILVCEMVVPPENNAGAFAKGLDLFMGLEQQGKERTLDEYGTLFAQSGLRLLRAYPTHSPQTILEAAL